MKVRTLLSAAIVLLCPLLASALEVDKPTFSLTFGPDWTEGFLSDPSVPFHTVADTVHDAPGFLQGMPVTAGTTAAQYLNNVTMALTAQYSRTDSSEKQLGNHRFKFSEWTEPDPEEEEEAETLRLYTLDAGGVAFFAWMSYEPGGEPAVAEFEAALATLQIKSVAVRDPRIRPGAASADAGAARHDVLGRARGAAGRLPAGSFYVFKR